LPPLLLDSRLGLSGVDDLCHHGLAFYVGNHCVGVFCSYRPSLFVWALRLEVPSPCLFFVLWFVSSCLQLSWWFVAYATRALSYLRRIILCLLMKHMPRQNQHVLKKEEASNSDDWTIPWTLVGPSRTMCIM
jgi:hypothetical protein